jgi:myo-inositol-1-phosphate synthase
MSEHKPLEASTEVRVAIVGVGNCASSLVQGVEYYQNADETSTVPGLMHVTFGQYHVRDVKFVAAFDVDAKKVGFDLSEAIFASENNTIKIADVPPTNVTVQRGPTLDGIGKYYADTIELSDTDPVDVVKVLRDAKADVLVSYLPVGSEEADKFYAQCAIDADVAFVNALPVFIASDPVWAKKFTDAGVPIVGDDIKSQVGATITHRVMAKLFEDRGVQLDRTMQLNVGGNMDFLNMLERERLESKKISKTQAVTSNLQREFKTKDVHIGPSDHVSWLDDRKWAYVRLEGRAFGDVPLNLEYKLEVWDSPNSAGVIIDAVRAAKIAKDRGIGGPVVAASAYLMKSPPQQLPDDVARTQLETFIVGCPPWSESMWVPSARCNGATRLRGWCSSMAAARTRIPGTP